MSALSEKKIRVKTGNMTSLKEYRDYLRENPRLAYLFLELTDQCNLSCRHCGSDCSNRNSTYIDAELLLSALKTIADDFDPSSVMLCLTGGEPMLHPDFYRIVQEGVGLGFHWGMTTNGTLISREDAKKLNDLGLQSITVSLDGTKGTHEWLRRREGCFGKTVCAIDYMKDEGIPVQVTTVVHKRNIGELDEIYKLVCMLGVYSWRVINVEPIGRSRADRDMLLSPKEFRYLIEYIRRKRYAKDTPFDVMFGCSHYLSYDYEREVRDNYFLCGSGIYVGSILCNGDIFSCLDIERRPELIQGNIREDRFSRVWFEKFREFRSARTKTCLKCARCDEKDFCDGDSTHTWDFDNNRPLFCFKDYLIR